MKSILYTITAIIIFFYFYSVSYSQNINKPNVDYYGGMRVNTFSGNLFFSRSDILIEGRGLPVDITFFYNNSLAKTSDIGFGDGWSMTYSMQYQKETNNVSIRWGDGRKDVYTLNGGIYSPPAGIFDSLSQYSPGKFKLKTKSGTQYFFNDSTHKKLTSVTDRNSNTLQISYTGNLPAMLTDPSGRTIEFQYTNGHLTKIRDLATVPVRVFTYQNDTTGNPVRVTDPLGKSVQYEYDLHGNITGILDQESNQFSISYFNIKFVKSISSPFKTIDINYDTAEMKTTVTEIVNGMSQSCSYDYDSTGNLRTKIDNCCGYNTSYTYDANRNITQKTDGNGNTYNYSYDVKGNLVSETDPSGGTITYSYELVFNKVVSMTDKRGFITTNLYDSKGNLLQTNKPLGVSLHYTYDAFGNMITSVDGRGLTTNYEYNSNGYMTKVTYSDGAINTFTYDNSGNKLSFTDAKGYTSTYQYDALDRKTKETNPLGHFSTYIYDSRNNLISETDLAGHVSSFTYDGLNRRLSTTTPAGTTSNTYDEAGNVLTETDRKGNVTTYTYDSKNRMITEKNPMNHTRHFTYDGNGNKLSETDFIGNSTTYQYDALNRMTRKTDAHSNNTFLAYDANGNQTSFTDANGNITIYTYDALNRNTAVQRPIGLTTIAYNGNDLQTSVTDPNGNITTTAYDNRNRITSVTDALGHSDLSTYDLNGNLLTRTDRNGNTTSFTYDALNRGISETNPAGNSTIITYNADNKITSLTSPSGNVLTNVYDAAHRLILTTDLEGVFASYTYDANSNQVTVTNGNSHTTIYNYDALNRVTSEIDRLGKTTSYTYNNNSSITSITDRNGKTSSFTYDALQRKISSISPSGFVTTTTYDAVGNILSLKDAKNNLTTYNYDGNNRLTSEHFANGSTTSYTYDAAGNKTSRTDNNGAVTAYSYDVLNRMILTNYPGANDNSFTYDNEMNILTASNANAAITFAYDNANRKISETMNGRTTAYSYNIAGRKRNVTYPGGRNIEESFDRRLRLTNVNDGVSIANNTYDAGNRILTRTFGNGVVSTYTYNNNDWITILSHKKGSDTVAIFNHAFDDEGNRLYEEKLHHKTNSEKYHYDNNYRLDSFRVGILSGGNITSGITQTKYNYDQVGNRTSVIKDLSTTAYTSNFVNSYINITDSISINPVYDLKGNTLNDGNYTYGYDNENRLTTVNGGAAGEYRYDALGRRILKITPSGTKKYYYDGERIIEECDGADAVQATYTYGTGLDDILNMVRSGVKYFYAKNSLGSVSAVTNNAGAVVERYEYDAFGKPLITDAAWVPRTSTLIGNSFMFTGREYDAEASNYHYRARNYKSDWGRFGQWDPIGYEDGMNLYEYVGNNPVMRLDPLGYKWVLKEQTSKPATDKWNEYTKSGTIWLAPDLSIHFGSYDIKPSNEGGSAVVKNKYWHDYSSFWGRSEHIVEGKWHRKYDCNQKTGELELIDGEGPKGTPITNYIAYVHMKVDITGEGTKKVHFTVELKTGANASVTVTNTTSIEGSVGGKEGKPGGKITMGSSFSWTGSVGITRGTTKDWFIECVCK